MGGLLQAVDNLYRWKIAARLRTVGVVLAAIALVSCSQPATEPMTEPMTEKPPASMAQSTRPRVRQTDAPAILQQLEPFLADYQPQVAILTPKPGQTIDSNTVDVTLEVKDLPIYIDEHWQLGPHLTLMLDDTQTLDVYDLSQPVTLTELTPGTHTLRAFASRPWHESFKNAGAYAAVQFHVFTPAGGSLPDEQPLLTFPSPPGPYGTTPVLLDFYLTDVPLHQVAQASSTLSDWQIRYTVNGESFTVSDWQPIYIEGLQPGKNWVRLTLVDEAGQPLGGAFNDIARLVTYSPGLEDGLSQLMAGEATLETVGAIVDPTYEPPAQPSLEEPAPEISEPADDESTAVPPEAPEAVPEIESPAPVPDRPHSPTRPTTPAPVEPPALEPEASDQSEADALLEEDEPVSLPDAPATTEASGSAEVTPAEPAPINATAAPDKAEEPGQPPANDSPEAGAPAANGDAATAPTEMPDAVSEEMPESAAQPDADPATALPDDAGLDKPAADLPESAAQPEQTALPDDAGPPETAQPRALQWLYDYRERSLETYGRPGS